MIKPLLANAERLGEGPANSAGRWRLNAGSEMILQVGQINGGKPIRVVLDVQTASFAAKRIVALSEHEGRQVVGYWETPSFDAASGLTDADLFIVKPSSQEESVVLAEAVRIHALVKNQVPIQTSIGAEAGPTGEFELVPASETIALNGRQYDGGGSLPLYVLRGGVITEASVVTFGADAETGRLAASRIKPPAKEEAPMSDKLKALLGKFPEKHHGLVARLVAESTDEAVITNKIHAAELDDKDEEVKSLKAKLHAAETELTDLKSKLQGDDYNQGDKDKKSQQDATQKLQQMAASKGVPHGEKKQESTATTLSDAMTAAITAGRPERGFTLRAALLRENPNLKRE